MPSLRNVITGVVLVSLQAGPALAQCGSGSCGAGVPGPEIGIGVLGLLIAGGAVHYLRQRAKR